MSDSSEVAQKITGIASGLEEAIRQEEIATNHIANSIQEIVRMANEQMDAMMGIKGSIENIFDKSKNINE